MVNGPPIHGGVCFGGDVYFLGGARIGPHRLYFAELLLPLFIRAIGGFSFSTGRNRKEFLRCDVSLTCPMNTHAPRSLFVGRAKAHMHPLLEMRTDVFWISFKNSNLFACLLLIRFSRVNHFIIIHHLKNIQIRRAPTIQ
jgi:hypothetical protein